MKRFFLCMAMASSLLLSGCAGSALYRGMDADGAFVSTASPSVAVQPAEGFKVVTSGKTLCRVPVEDSFNTLITADVWYALAAKDGAQLVSVLGECDSDWVWGVRAVGVDFQRLPVLYEYNGVESDSAMLRVYVRPGRLDPWMPMFRQSGGGWDGDVLVARYEWLGGADQDKLIVEYREPAPAMPETFAVRTAEMGAFLDRAKAAFSMGKAQSPVSLAPAGGHRVSDDLLSSVLGSVSLPAWKDWI